MTAQLDAFPLATALTKIIEPQVADLVKGLDTALLEEVTSVTAELLKYWFQEDYCALRQQNFHQGQRSAVLHIIYAHEVVQAKTLDALYREVAPEALLVGTTLADVSQEQNLHPKYAAKMATGTGKTLVLNALLVWQYLNHLAYPDDERFTANFLVVAPGLIVYDRLLDSFMGKERDGERVFEISDIYSNADVLVPDHYREAVFGFAGGRMS